MPLSLTYPSNRSIRLSFLLKTIAFLPNPAVLPVQNSPACLSCKPSKLFHLPERLSAPLHDIYLSSPPALHAYMYASPALRTCLFCLACLTCLLVLPRLPTKPVCLPRLPDMHACLPRLPDIPACLPRLPDIRVPACLPRLPDMPG